MKKAIFIVGPTAVGKTSLAVKINHKISSLLISADSIQVYRGADIISGKDHPKDVKIELVDIFPPTESFSVRDFVDRVNLLAKKSELKQKIPIIVGGTGMYIKSLFTNIETINIKPDEQLRSKLGDLSIEELQQKLRNLDALKFGDMNNSDKNNSRRLIRAIEVALGPSSSRRSQKKATFFLQEDVLIIGLTTPSQDLRKRIEMRVEERIKAGALDEAKKLFKIYEKLSPQLKAANGYRQMFEFLQGKISWEAAIEHWITADYQHSNAQMTYFKKLSNIEWFEIDKKGFEDKIFKLVNKFVPGR